jgi:hypothetical protein
MFIGKQFCLSLILKGQIVVQNNLHFCCELKHHCNLIFCWLTLTKVQSKWRSGFLCSVLGTGCGREVTVGAMARPARCRHGWWVPCATQHNAVVLRVEAEVPLGARPRGLRVHPPGTTKLHARFSLSAFACCTYSARCVWESKNVKIRPVLAKLGAQKVVFTFVVLRHCPRFA